jgi:hypothetical protein
MALISAGSAVFESTGQPAPDAQAIAYRAFRLAAQTADALHNAALSSLALGNLGRLYERAGQGEEAERLTGQALFAAQRASSPDLSFRWEWQRGRLARAEGRSDVAIASDRAPSSSCSRSARTSPWSTGRGAPPIGRLLGLSISNLLIFCRAATGRSKKCATADQGGTGYGRATKGDRVAGLFPRLLRHQLLHGRSAHRRTVEE